MLQPNVLIPLVLFTAALIGFFVWYRGKIKDLKIDSGDRPIASGRLTTERLRDLSSPPWRVVFEISEKHLGAVDHVVVGPSGVLAIETVAGDRPAGGNAINEAQLIANAAITRGDVDDLATRVGASCKTLVRVYWGTPDPEAPAGVQVVPGLITVEGQRLNDWLVTLPPGPLQPAQIDQVWQAITTGIGRPDPLS